jgi:hypothetical protein
LIQRRVQLINLVFEEQMPVATAARRLDIKKSTARSILKKYTLTGKILVKKMVKQHKKWTSNASISGL